MKYFFVKPVSMHYSDCIIPGIPSLIGILENENVECKYINLNLRYNDYLTKEKFVNYYNSLNKFYKEKEYLNYPQCFISSLKDSKKVYLKNLNWLIKNINNFNLGKSVLKQKNCVTSSILYNYLTSFYSSIRKMSLLFLCNFKHLNINIDDLIFLFESPLNNLKEFYEEQVNTIIAQNPNVVGIQVTLIEEMLSGLYLGYLIKKKNKNIHVNFGGNLFEMTRNKRSNLKDFFRIFFDSISIGDSTKTVIELIKYVNNEISIDEVSNLLHIKNGDLNFNEQKISSNVDTLPFQSFSGYEKQNLLLSEFILPVRATTTNSCYWGKCIFCTCSASNEPYKIMSVKRFTDEIEYLSKKYNTKYFMFWDNALPPKYLEKVAEILIEKKLNIKYSLYARLEKPFTSELLKKMKKSGCFLIHWGLDSASKRLSKFINKGIDVEDAKDVLKRSHNVGISNFVYLIAGLPTETIEDFEENLNFLKTNKKNIDIIYISSETGFYEGSIINENQEYYKSLINNNEEYIDKRNKLIGEIYKMFSFPIFCPELEYAYILKYGILRFKILKKILFYYTNNKKNILIKLINIYFKNIYLKLCFLNHTFKW